jgi:hypothetical protein
MLIRSTACSAKLETEIACTSAVWLVLPIDMFMDILYQGYASNGLPSVNMA